MNKIYTLAHFQYINKYQTKIKSVFNVPDIAKFVPKEINKNLIR